MEFLVFGGDIFLGAVIVTWLLQWIIPPVVIQVDSICIGQQVRGLNFLFLVFIRRDSYCDAILRHEFVHYRQQRYFSPIGLALFMLIYYVILYVKYRSFQTVYQKSIIEKQAYEQMYQNRPLPFHIKLN